MDKSYGDNMTIQTVKELKSYRTTTIFLHIFPVSFHSQKQKFRVHTEGKVIDTVHALKPVAHT